MREKYESLQLVHLRELAKARGLKGVSAMKKADIVNLMLEEDEKDKAKAEAARKEEAAKAEAAKREEAAKAEAAKREEAAKAEAARKEEAVKAEAAKREEAAKAEKRDRQAGGCKKGDREAGGPASQGQAGERSTESGKSEICFQDGSKGKQGRV